MKEEWKQLSPIPIKMQVLLEEKDNNANPAAQLLNNKRECSLIRQFHGHTHTGMHKANAKYLHCVDTLSTDTTHGVGKKALQAGLHTVYITLSSF